MSYRSASNNRFFRSALHGAESDSLDTKQAHRCIAATLTRKSIREFRELFELPKAYTNQKIIDTLLWRFSAYARGGAIMNDEMQYS